METTSLLTLHQRWPGLKQAFRVTRERTMKGKTSVEIAYGITSLSPEEASATKLLALNRRHWSIENSLHYVRDVTLREDACRVRKGNAPQVLAALRNATIHLLTQIPAPSRAAAIRSLSIHPAKTLALIHQTK